MDKTQLRARGKKILSELNPEDKKRIEHSFYLHLFKSDIWKKAISIGVTVSQESEWNTEPIIRQAWDENKFTVVPKCEPKSKRLDFYKLDDFDQLETVYFGLKEPDPTKTEPLKKSQIDLLIVPGLIYDRHGFRVGFGGGYYDRFLENYEGETVSLAASNQIVETIPKDEFDIPVNHLITEEGFLY
ncbi:5-formyltetrahydrofolate cyclo-ligase [Thalassobacillus hwangdonensis]|uniref:5-formyltetrahydrofolate cyclo-ligase n=1 Tax=Thalassobacillus hwangdonensis TaxID=546108 RepID=A0ABW3L085_9BACI